MHHKAFSLSNVVDRMSRPFLTQQTKGAIIPDELTEHLVQCSNTMDKTFISYNNTGSPTF